MASYKVPQDVEADDKLIGPFSFRQFIYLIVVALAIALAWGLGQLFIGLAIIPLPIILLFGALALPLRKDQPMEIYLAAMISFLLKPRSRLWSPDGIESNIEISAPKTTEIKRTKDLSEGEAHERLNYLANLVDTQGWSIRGVQSTNLGMNADVVLEAQSAEDILDTNTSVANTFGQMMEESTRKMHEEARQRMAQAIKAPQPAPVMEPVFIQPAPQPVAVPQPIVQQPQPEVAPQPTPVGPAPQPVYQQPVDTTQVPVFNPHPTIPQPVIHPLDPYDHTIELPHDTPGLASSAPEPVAEPVEVDEPEPSTSEKQPATGIIELANNSDLSIQTIARQAGRINKKAEESGEVVISLR